MAAHIFQEIKPTPKPMVYRRLIFKLLRLGLGIGGLVLVANLLWARSQTLISRQGVVNAPVITVRSPLEGKLTLIALEPGAVLTASAAIGTVENPRQAQLVIDRQHTTGQIEQILSQRQGLQARLQNRQALLNQFQQEARQQQTLQNNYQAQQVNQMRSDLVAAQSAAAVAALEAQRYSTLAERGAVARSVADQTIATAEQTAAGVQRQQAALTQALAEQAAAAQGLQLEGARVFSYPDVRVREINQEMADLRQQQADLDATLRATRQELIYIDQQLALAQTAPIVSPATGVVWSVPSPTGALGDHIEAGSTVVQLLDCDNLWVDAFVSERQVSTLQVGEQARVRFLSDRPGTWRAGTIASIRAGVGRTATGDDVAVPPPELVRREVAVRVRLAEVPLTPAEFCGVGRSVEVTFPRSPAAAAQQP
ncbi:MAG: HlyD family efflux transporter periplasmic adaptor subunit [Leptolyngbya sp. DLM2.Bin27]|nr:MAG: HlyD family efflux transporter periplasmic adaptor subunit [Leptolyngbya sp. DLM2.Bin27]